MVRIWSSSKVVRIRSSAGGVVVKGGQLGLAVGGCWPEAVAFFVEAASFFDAIGLEGILVVECRRCVGYKGAVGVRRIHPKSIDPRLTTGIYPMDQAKVKWDQGEVCEVFLHKGSPHTERHVILLLCVFEIARVCAIYWRFLLGFT